MGNRLKRALVENYVGTIGIGWLMAQGVLHFANIFTAPLSSWVVRHEFIFAEQHAQPATGLPFTTALPELARSICLLLISYLLLRWLYFKPLEPQPTVPVAQPSSPA